ncbi:MAG: 30S ribosomal protein S8, partial [Pelagibacteraceae bacterium]
SKFKKFVLDAMEREGFIVGYDTVKNENGSFDNLKVVLKYVHGSPVINEINRVSKPGRRIYTRFDSLPRVQNGLGVAIISTSHGILTDNEAREKKVGGEIICNIS